MTKDALSKAFFGKPEIAADLCNGVVFQGKPVVRAENLKGLSPEQVCIDGARREGRIQADRRQRDLLFLCGAYGDGSMDILILGIEVQSSVDRQMLFRVMEYDARQYMLQFRSRRFRETGLLLPVVTFVVNLSGFPWEAPASIHAMLGPVDRRLKPFVHDYAMNLLDPFGMSENMCGAFCTELKTVVNCFRASRDKRRLMEFLREGDSHARVSPEAAGLLAGFLNVELPNGEQEEGVDMCQAMMEILKDARDEGMAEGMERGKAEGMESVVTTALKRNLPPEDIQDITGISLEFILAVRQKLTSA